jgi:sugar-specific transcriptional regulator TrmB
LKALEELGEKPTFSQDEVEFLTKLGLSVNQAKIYLSLVRVPPSTAYQISKYSNLANETVYKTMPTLQKLGLVEKLITHPTTFRSIPIERGFRNLLAHRDDEQKELLKKAKHLLCRIRNNCAEGTSYPSKGESNFTLIQAKENISESLEKALDKTHENLRIVTSQLGLSTALQVYADAHRRALARGVKILIASEKHVLGKIPLRILHEFQTSEGFEVRYFREYPEAIVLIFDGKEACHIMLPKAIFPTADLSKASVLWSNNDSFISLAEYYFQSKWNSAKSEENSKLS